MLCWDDLVRESSYCLLQETENCEETEVMRGRSGEDKGGTGRLVAWEDVSGWLWGRIMEEQWASDLTP